MTHREWLDTLPLRDRLVYDRAYGACWFRGADNQEACRAAGRNAVEQRQEMRSANG